MQKFQIILARIRIRRFRCYEKLASTLLERLIYASSDVPLKLSTNQTLFHHSVHLLFKKLIALFRETLPQYPKECFTLENSLDLI
jgi:hypothetical protein